MSAAVVIVPGVVIATAVAVYFVWPNRFVMNVIRTARHGKSQMTLNELSVAELAARARIGDAPAKYRLDYLHATGDGVALDYARANYWLERAAARGIAEASYCLALHYERGRGTGVDLPKALELYEKAARADSGDAQCNLGVMLLNGVGAEANVVRAGCGLFQRPRRVTNAQRRICHGSSEIAICSAQRKWQSSAPSRCGPLAATLTRFSSFVGCTPRGLQCRETWPLRKRSIREHNAAATSMHTCCWRSSAVRHVVRTNQESLDSDRGACVAQLSAGVTVRLLVRTKKVAGSRRRARYAASRESVP